MKEFRDLCIIENVRKFGSREYEGSLLNELGYTFFEPGKEYTIWESDYSGLFLAFTYDSGDSPDEDGFGAEIYYYWWFLDEHLQQIPGTKCSMPHFVKQDSDLSLPRRHVQLRF